MDVLKMKDNITKKDDIEEISIKDLLQDELMNILYIVRRNIEDSEILQEELKNAIMGLVQKNILTEQENIHSISDKYLYFNYKLYDEYDGFYNYNIVVVNKNMKEFYFSTAKRYSREIRQYILDGQTILKNVYSDDWGLFSNNKDDSIDKSIKNLQYLLKINE